MSAFNIYLNLVPVSLTQGAVYALPALGVMIPFRLLSLPDLTAEGSFPLGGAVAASLMVAGFNPVTAMLCAALAGCAAGGVTAMIHLFLKVPTLLAGIIVLTMLYSINIRVMGKPNTAIFNIDTIFTSLLGQDGGTPLLQFALLLCIILAFCIVLYWFLNTELGLSIRSVGANQTMSRAQGLATNKYIMGAIGIAGALSAFGGSIMAQYQSYADINMGVGVLIIGLASTILGEALIGRATLIKQITAPVIGAIIYFQIIAMALALGLKPSDLKLLTGLFIIATLTFPIINEQRKKKHLKKI